MVEYLVSMDWALEVLPPATRDFLKNPSGIRGQAYPASRKLEPSKWVRNGGHGRQWKGASCEQTLG